MRTSVLVPATDISLVILVIMDSDRYVRQAQSDTEEYISRSTTGLPTTSRSAVSQRLSNQDVAFSRSDTCRYRESRVE